MTAEELRQLSAREVKPLPVIGYGLVFLAAGLAMNRVYLAGQEAGIQQGLDKLLQIWHAGVANTTAGVEQLYSALDLLLRQSEKLQTSIQHTEFGMIESTAGGLALLLLNRAWNLRIPVSDRVLPWVAGRIAPPDLKKS